MLLIPNPEDRRCETCRYARLMPGDAAPEPFGIGMCHEPDHWECDHPNPPEDDMEGTGRPCSVWEQGTDCFHEYEKAAMGTQGEGTREERLLNATLGMCGEAGEFAEKVKHAVFMGHPFDILGLAEELGDQLWYITWAANILGFSLQEIAETNLAKLKKRYPNGWDPERSINRGEVL